MMVRSPAIAEIIAGLVKLDAELAQPAAPEDEFSTDRPAPYTSRRTHNEWCAGGEVEGARKVGRKWVCSQAAWFRARAKRPAAAPLRLVEPQTSDEERATSFLKNAGYQTVAGLGGGRPR